MARKPRPSRSPRPAAPVPAPAPRPAELLTGPRTFAARLARTPPQVTRYLGAVALGSALSGVAYALLVRPAATLAAGLTPNGAPVLLTHVTNAFGGLFLGLLTFGALWGGAHLLARREARAAEVYGASFALLPPLYLAVILLTLLTPAAAWVPEQAAGTARQVERAALRDAAHTPAALALYTAAFLGTAAQGLLAYPAFRTLGVAPARALAAAILPLLPALAVQALGLAPVLLNR